MISNFIWLIICILIIIGVIFLGILALESERKKTESVEKDLYLICGFNISRKFSLSIGCNFYIDDKNNQFAFTINHQPRIFSFKDVVYATLDEDVTEKTSGSMIGITNGSLMYGTGGSSVKTTIDEMRLMIQMNNLYEPIVYVPVGRAMKPGSYSYKQAINNVREILAIFDYMRNKQSNLIQNNNQSLSDNKLPNNNTSEIHNDNYLDLNKIDNVKDNNQTLLLGYSISKEFSNALRFAESFLQTTPVSKKGLKEQLKFSGKIKKCCVAR